MAKYLTSEWLEDVVCTFGRLPARPDMNATIQYVVTADATGDDAAYYWVVRDGKIVEASLGEAPSPDFTFTVAHSDSVQLERGELDDNAAFLQGKLKFRGDMAALMRLAPLMDGAEFAQLQQELRDRTAY